jgi:diguanylate cyclase (GGDEF)-like protein/PAS domain S-box-containing protein
VTASDRSGANEVLNREEAQFRTQVLELLVENAPLTRIFEVLLHGFEALRPGALCSLIRLDEEGKRVAHAMGPSLPDFYTSALVGLEIGPAAGSCGTAAYTASRVVVEDIATHPYWEPYRPLARQARLAACWSQPIVSSSGKVLGTFAIYYHEPRAPEEVDLVLIQQYAALACIAIERDTEGRQLRESEARYRTLVEFLPMGIIVHQQTRVVYANPAAAQILAAENVMALMGQSIMEMTHPDFRDITRQRLRLREESGVDPPPVDMKLIRMDGSVVDVQMAATLIQYGGAPAIQASFTDITERQRAKDKLQLAANVFSHAREGIVITDADTRIVEVNRTFTTITGYEREEVMGTQPYVLRSGLHSDSYLEALWKGLQSEGHWSGEIWNVRKNGDAYVEMLTISSVTGAQGAVQNYVMLFTDITAMKTYQKQLENLAHFDTLTHLPNRLLLADRLHQAMSQSQRRKQALAVVFLDLDGFKLVNDTHGHDVGDELLVVLSQRMKGALRDGDTLARLGGDEFVAVLVDLDHSDDSEPVLDRLLQAASEPVTVDGAQFQVSASMGIAVYPRDGTHPDLLLRRADQSMYRAKMAGRNRFHFLMKVKKARVSSAESIMRLA